MRDIIYKKQFKRATCLFSRLWLLLAAILTVGGGFYFLAVTPSSVNGWKRQDIAKEVFSSQENLKLFATSEIMVARRLTPLEHGGTLLGSYEMVNTVNFSKMQGRLATLIKPLFPDDPAIQALR